MEAYTKEACCEQYSELLPSTNRTVLAHTRFLMVGAPKVSEVGMQQGTSMILGRPLRLHHIVRKYGCAMRCVR